jgi:hypothetical protein
MNAEPMIHGILTDDSKRDLELILLGAVLAKGEARKLIFDSAPTGSIDSEIGALIDSVREQDAQPISSWLESHQCEWDKGQCFIQTIANRLLEDKQRRLMIDVLKGLTFLAQTAPLDETKAKTVSLLEKIWT